MQELSDAVELLARLKYDEASGEFFWITPPPKQNRLLGKRAGRVNSRGYCGITFKRKNYYTHRLVWLVETGLFPSGIIDHVNGNKSDNRITNLRDCTAKENNNNRIEHRLGKLRGCSFRKDNKKWRAYVCENKRHVSIGQFNSEKEAHEAVVRREKTCRI